MPSNDREVCYGFFPLCHPGLLQRGKITEPINLLIYNNNHYYNQNLLLIVVGINIKIFSQLKIKTETIQQTQCTTSLGIPVFTQKWSWLLKWKLKVHNKLCVRNEFKVLQPKAEVDEPGISSCWSWWPAWNEDIQWLYSFSVCGGCANFVISSWSLVAFSWNTSNNFESSFWNMHKYR